MNDTAVLLAALESDPGDDTLWLALADALEEQGETASAEITRLSLRLRRSLGDPEHPAWERRLRELAGQGGRVPLPRKTLSLAPNVELSLVLAPPGSFRMGSPPTESERDSDEPLHRVTLTRGFWVGVFPVTQDQWRTTLGENPSAFVGDDRPVESVTWEECRDFCRRLRERTGHSLDLPSEAQWEYACRAGTTTPFHFGERLSLDQANFQEGESETGAETTPVGRYPSNPWGLFDVHGNVWEWCRDRYTPNPSADCVDPLVLEGQNRRVLRGGSCLITSYHCRSAYRNHAHLDHVDEESGCRVVVNL
jgi:uncharacterized protein (TIGR02996 family)